MRIHLNSYNSNKRNSPQISECKVLNRGSMKQRHTNVSVTAPEQMAEFAVALH
jgi:hypothetical protein